jgi:uncharacterized membrane protein
MAALAHAGIMFPMWGLLTGIVIWLLQKDKSEYVRFQALQSIAYQLTLTLCGFLLAGCYACSIFSWMFAMPIGVAFGSEDQLSPIAIPFFLLPFVVVVAVVFLAVVGGLTTFIYGLVGAVQTLQGKDFDYIIIGKRVRRFLSQD